MKISPRPPAPTIIWARAYVKKKSYREAIAEFKQALEIQPEFADAYNNLEC